MHQTSSIGGGSYCLLNLVKVLDRSYWTPIVALKEDGPLVSELLKIGIEVVFFREMSTIPYNRSLWNYNTLRAYRKAISSRSKLNLLIKANSIDVLYLNNMMLCHYLPVAKINGCKTVLHIREHWPLAEHKWQLKRIRDCVYNYTDELIAINNYSASIFPQKTATIVYDWIDMKERDRHVMMDEVFGEDMKDKKVYLYTGGMQRIKGPYEVISTFTKIIRDDNSRLLVMGFTKDYQVPGIKGKIKNALSILGFPTYDYKVKAAVNLDNRITCIPSDYCIKPFLDQSYCMLSYFKIPHANLTLAEAMIQNLPCIAAMTEESLEYSQDGSLAMLYQFNDLNDFKNKVLELDIYYKELKNRLIEHNVELQYKFSRERNVNLLLSVLDSFK